MKRPLSCIMFEKVRWVRKRWSHQQYNTYKYKDNINRRRIISGPKLIPRILGTWTTIRYSNNDNKLIFKKN